MNAAQQIHHALGYGQAPANMRLPLPLPAVAQHRNAKRNAERKLVKAIGIRQAKKQRYAARAA